MKNVAKEREFGNYSKCGSSLKEVAELLQDRNKGNLHTEEFCLEVVQNCFGNVSEQSRYLGFPTTKTVLVYHRFLVYSFIFSC